jgi:hypothetical protein
LPLDVKRKAGLVAAGLVAAAAGAAAAAAKRDGWPCRSGERLRSRRETLASVVSESCLLCGERGRASLESVRVLQDVHDSGWKRFGNATTAVASERG